LRANIEKKVAAPQADFSPSAPRLHPGPDARNQPRTRGKPGRAHRSGQPRRRWFPLGQPSRATVAADSRTQR
jgi:hypothetical protein